MIPRNIMKRTIPLQSDSNRRKNHPNRSHRISNDLTKERQNSHSYPQVPAMISRANSDGPSTVDGSHSNQRPLEDHELDTMCRTVNDVFHFELERVIVVPIQTLTMYWFGESVPTCSATLPAGSLAIILSNTKALEPNKGLRSLSVLRRACKLNDAHVSPLYVADRQSENS